MSTVKLTNLTKKFSNKVTAVDNVSLQIDDGEFLVLLGPSGCGKTTIMRMIAGLEEVTDGSVHLDGKDITHIDARYRNIGMVFQRYAIWPHMTIRENITFPLKLKKYSKDKINKIVEKVAKMTEIGPYLDRYVGQLSGGQCQRAAVARAVAYEPKIYLMDEPLSALDAKLRESMRTDLKEIQRESGITTIFVTHDQAEALSLADRIVVMKDGIIMQIGTPKQVYDDCDNMFIADFIGTPPTNFFDGKIKFSGEKCRILNREFEFDYNSKALKGLKKYDGKEVTLGIRPENMVVKNKIQEDSIISVKCSVVEPQGSHEIVVVHINNKKIKLVISDNKNIKRNDDVYISFINKRIMFFDKETGERIR